MNTMAWLPISAPDDEKILFIRDDHTNGGHMPYNRHPLGVKDYDEPGGSKGYATMQALLKRGYTLTNSSKITQN